MSGNTRLQLAHAATLRSPARPALCAFTLLSFACRPAQEAELEGQLFGRDEEALQQLGQEVAAGGSGGGSLANFLRSYAAGAAAAEEQDEDEDADDHRQRQAIGQACLGLFEDRQGGGGDSDGAGVAAEGEGGSTQLQLAGKQRQRRRPVWEDPQDEALRVNVAVKNQLRKLRQTEEEAVLTGG